MFKNWILWKRRLCGSLTEVLFPIFIFLVLALLRAGTDWTNHDAKSYLYESGMAVSYTGVNNFGPYFEPTINFTDDAKRFSSNYLMSFNRSMPNNWHIAFVNEKQLEFNNEIIQDLKNKINENKDFNYKFVNYDSENDLEDYIEADDYGKDENPKIALAIVFYNKDPFNIEYSFRFNTTLAVPKNGRIGKFIDIFNYREYKEQDSLLRKPKPSFQYNYFSTNFIHFMNFIDNIILQKYSSKPNPYIAAGFVPMYYQK